MKSRAGLHPSHYPCHEDEEDFCLRDQVGVEVEVLGGLEGVLELGLELSGFMESAGTDWGSKGY